MSQANEQAPFDVRTHNGWITVENTNTGGHRTFAITTAKDGGLKGRRIVHLMVGSDRELKPFGFVTPRGVAPWASMATGAWVKFARILNFPERGRQLGLAYLFDARCRVCDRKLTNPASIRSGIGPVCEGRE